MIAAIRKGNLMTSKTLTKLAMATCVSLFAFGPALAASQDYKFEMVGEPVKSANATTIKVRLVHVADGKAVTGAKITETKFDMGPAGMAGMTAPAQITSGEAGIYQVETKPSMAGKWALTLTATVPGESEPVKGMLAVGVAK